VQTVVQGAADAAALAGGGSPSTTDAQLVAIANRYIQANAVHDDLSELSVRKIKNNKASGTFTVEVEATMKTSFMALAGINSVAVSAMSEVKRGSNGPLEMVLALDTTASMNTNGKIDTLKSAATDLVNAVMTSENVKVGVAPFADYFKIGTAYKGEPWVTVPPDSTYNWCETSYPNRTGCTMQTQTCYNDGVPYSCVQEQCKDWGAPVQSNCGTFTSKWVGCVASRPDGYRDTVANANKVPYPGVNWDCGTAMLPLTDKKSDVLATINALGTYGNTHIPSGLIWAWNILSEEAPLTEAMPMATVLAKGGKKAIVLMTDGANSSSPYSDGNYGADADTEYKDNTYTNGLTASICAKIKAEGTIVYTVLFDVTDPQIEALLHDCASDPGKSYVASDAAGLQTAFKNIGTSLTQLRLTK
jgi:Mg-chelatase subunit ChlD